MHRPLKQIVGIFLILTLYLAPTAIAEEKIQVLILSGFDVGAHKWREMTQHSVAILEATGRFDVKVSEDLGILESSSLDHYAVVVLHYGYWDAPEPSDRAKAALLDYVKQGKGLVSLHFACSSFQDWEEYAALLGRVWKKGVGGHGPRGKFMVKVEDTDHPITSGLTDFEMDDELYSKLTGSGTVEILATAYSDWSKQVEPLVFLHRYGKGTVVQNLLGHDIQARENDSYKVLLCRCVEYAATGKVTLK